VAQAPELLGCAIAVLRIPGADVHLGSALNETLRDESPDPAGSAGDEYVKSANVEQ
jgi:hypothetical protein